MRIGIKVFLVYVWLLFLSPGHMVRAAPMSAPDSFVEIRRRSVSLLEGSSSSAALAMQLEIGTYAAGETLATIKAKLEGQGIADLRSSPEGLECLAEQFRTKSDPNQSDIEQFLNLCSPEYRITQSKKLSAKNKEPGLPPLRPVQIARFGPLTAITLVPASGVAAGPLADLSFIEMMVQNGNTYQLVESSPLHRDFATRCFISVVSNVDDSDYLSQNLDNDQRYTSLTLECPVNQTHPVNDRQSSSLKVSVLVSSIQNGPVKDFFNEVLSTVANGSDDQIRKLFDNSDPFYVDQLFGTVNDREELESFRDDVRAGHVTQSVMVTSTAINYIIFAIVEPPNLPASPNTPSTQASDVKRVFILRCSNAQGKLRLTGSSNPKTSDPAEQVLGNHSLGALMRASDVCGRLLAVQGARQ